MRVFHAVSLAVSLLLPFPAALAAENLDPGALLAVKQVYAEAMVDQGLVPTLQLSPIISEFLAGADSAEVSPAQPPGDLWERIRMGFALGEMDTPLVQEHENWYASRPDYVRRMVERSQLYLFHIVEEVEKRGMPTEIALLPMIESAFNPKAYSRAHASGIWQFIPSTGKNFGLQQNWWYDGRRDIMAATDAALDYLQKLHDMFGSWELALSAYNWGEGNVMRAIGRNGAKGLPTDILSLRMPPETRNYLPKLLAIKHIVANPEAYGLALAPIPNQPYFTKVATSKHIDLALAARLAEMPMAEFTSLNPAHNRPVINSKDADYLLLPVDKVETFVNNLESYDKPLVSWGSYTLGRGEKLDKVAHKFSLSVSRLKEINGISGNRRLAGGTLLVPLGRQAASGDALAGDFTVRDEPEAAAGGKPLVHAVKKGDTLLGIARRYAVAPEQIKALNHLKSNRVAVGQKLVLSKAAPARKSAAAKPSAPSAKRAAAAKSTRIAVTKPRSTQYTVRRGDTLSSIAKRYNVAANDIQRWNNISAKRPLNPGLKVTLFIPPG